MDASGITACEKHAESCELEVKSLYLGRLSFHISWTIINIWICQYFRQFGKVKAEPAFKQEPLDLFVYHNGKNTQALFFFI